MENQQIVKIHDRASGRLLKREVLGLNILWVNESDFSVGEDPQLEFLRQLCSANAVSVNVGNLHDYADEPEDLFAPTAYSGRYRTVRIGCYGGEFYDSQRWSNFPPLFFESISPDFIDITEQGDSLVRRVLQLDASAYFISPREPDSAEKVFELLNEPFDSSEVITEKSLDFFKLIGFSQADGDYFSFISRTEEDFSILNEPLASAIDLIESSTWHRENRSKLTWDEDSACLKSTGENSSC